MKADFFAPTVRAGEVVQFINLSSGAATSWVWKINGVIISRDKNPEYLFEKAGTYQVSLTLIDENRHEMTKGKTVFVLEKGFANTAANEEVYEVYEPEVLGNSANYNYSSNDYITSFRSERLEKQLEEIKRENRMKSIPAFFLFAGVFSLFILFIGLMSNMEVSEDAGIIGRIIWAISKMR